VGSQIGIDSFLEEYRPAIVNGNDIVIVNIPNMMKGNAFIPGGEVVIVNLELVNDIEEVSAEEMIFDLVMEKRRIRLSTYTEDEYNLWVSGLRSLRRALSYQTPYDWSPCTLTRRTLKEYKEYYVDLETALLVDELLSSNTLDKDEEAFHFRSEMRGVLDAVAADPNKKPLNKSELAFSTSTAPSWFPEKFFVRFYFPKDELFKGLPEYCSVSCTSTMLIGQAIRQAFQRGLRSLSTGKTTALTRQTSQLIHSMRASMKPGVITGDYFDDTYQENTDPTMNPIDPSDPRANPTAPIPTPSNPNSEWDSDLPLSFGLTLAEISQSFSSPSPPKTAPAPTSPASATAGVGSPPGVPGVPGTG